MIGTIKKDLFYVFSSKRERLFYLLYLPFLLLIINTQDTKWLYFAIIYSYTYLVCISTISYDSNLKFSYILNSLPITRKEVVLYKYISLFIHLGIIIVYAGVYLWIINVLGIKNVDYFNLEMIIKVIPMLMISLSIVYPAYFILGPKLAKITHMIVFISFFIGIISISGEDLAINNIFQFMTSGRFIILAIVIYTNGHDTRNKAEIVINSFPINRSDIVKGKYMTLIIFIIIIGSTLFLSSNLIRELFSKFQGGKNITIRNIIVAANIVLLFYSIYYPIYFKVGEDMRTFNYILWFLVIVSPSLVKKLVEWLIKNDMLDEILSIDFNKINISILIVLIIIFYISLQISKKIYKQREF